MKRVFIVLILFIAVFISANLLLSDRKVSSNSSAKQKIERNTLEVTQKIGEEEKKYSVEAGTTALRLLTDSASIESKGEGKSSFIVSINGRKADDKKKEFWALYINGKQAEVGAGSYQLKNKDIILWKIETY